MGKKRVTVTVYVCERCGHEWQSSLDGGPTICAACKSPYWDRPRVTA